MFRKTLVVLAVLTILLTVSRFGSTASAARANRLVRPRTVTKTD
ncbi:MAG TPA: hypothetical protein VFB12_31020 [Ktedonobacteraceae bacterium]|nr:hypothetical protein [Ktedonobacteraceae bacterium]